MNIRYSDKIPEVEQSYVDPMRFQKIFELKNRIDKITANGDINIWSNVIKLNNPYENVPFLDKKRRINRAFYKLLEIHDKFNILTFKRDTLGFICESPGGFIECAKHVKDNERCIYLAQSLKDSECHFCNKVKEYTKVFYGPDNSGDILKIGTIEDFVNKVSCFNNCDVITGDGGFDVSENYIKQEQLSFRLIFCQIVTGIGCLKLEGDLICKIFESYTLPTIELIFILKKYFVNVFIFKPLISRPCNSERYIIAKNFKGINRDDYNELLKIVKMLETKNIVSFGVDIPQKFVEKMYNINNSFIDDQIKSFNVVFSMYDNINNFSDDKINTLNKINEKKCINYLNNLI